MKRMIPFVLMGFLSGCTPGAWAQVKDVTRAVLSAAQVACVLTSPFIQTVEVLKACDIAEKYAPQVDEFLEGRAMAQREGVCK